MFVWISSFFYTISVFSSAIGITFFAVYFIFDVFLFKRIGGAAGWHICKKNRKVLIEKLILAFPAIFISMMSVIVRFYHVGLWWKTPVQLSDFGLIERIMQAMYILSYYLWRPFYTVHLAPYYNTLVSFDPLSIPFITAELGVDLAVVRGSGPGGRIQRRDVEAAAAGATERRAPEPLVPPAAPVAPVAVGEDRQAGMRRAIAAAMTRSKREVPHFYLSETIDLSAATRRLADENLHRPVQERLLPGGAHAEGGRARVARGPRAERGLARGARRPERGCTPRHRDLPPGRWARGSRIARCRSSEPRRAHARLSRPRLPRPRRNAAQLSSFSDPTITVTSLGERGAETVLPIIFPPQVAIVDSAGWSSVRGSPRARCSRARS